MTILQVEFNLTISAHERHTRYSDNWGFENFLQKIFVLCMLRSEKYLSKNITSFQVQYFM